MSNSSNCLESSGEIWAQALDKYDYPYATVLALSGGNDSRAAYYAAKALNIKIDYILHVNTRTGIQETTEWVRWFSNEYAQVSYIEGDAGDTYQNYILRKGFFGKGTGQVNSAHSFAFRLLKRDVYVNALSRHIRKRKRNRKIFLLNGARLSESRNRSINLVAPVRADKLTSDGKDASSNIWVNLLQSWDKEDCEAICQENNAPQNPVTQQLCRSGECMCGTTQSQAERNQAAAIYPEWGEWIDRLDRYGKESFGFGWGENAPKTCLRSAGVQLDLFQPMCSTCNHQASLQNNEN
ncbi:MAG: hypothetical protein AAFY72_06830 [Cyanobacteria bacterium J06649_4]